ncbi:MAG: hypothetical protein L0H84_20570 [Pseudonocardia sp.]|nr:hypothetical protein [Pseudonocardia sp.]
MDPGLRFWLRYVEHRGGLAERGSDGTLVMLPEQLAGDCDLPTELVVTSDPDVAREDDTVLLSTGHPLLVRAADAVLTDGDAGVLTLAEPTTPAPVADLLQAHARDQFPVDHGRIEVSGLPCRITRPVLRVGALVTYTVSAEESYQESVECWVDGRSRLPLTGAAVSRLQRAPLAARPKPHRAILPSAITAIEKAHRILDTAAVRRRDALSERATDAHRQERTHARAYYDETLRSLEKRRAAATPDRAELLAARAVSTREERTRRLAEIDEKYQARHEVRPFRLHVVAVPGWRVPLDIRRGPRRYPVERDWLPALGGYAEERCPHCDDDAPLSAGKTRLGCVHCQSTASSTSAAAAS